MTVDEAIADLTIKADPTRAWCLRCCSIYRCHLRLLAEAPYGHAEQELTDAFIDAEVADLLARHPELRGRFEPNGLPLGMSCEEARLAG